ncbi:DUF3592 domain-containing protein [Streptomyces sp. NRRL B-24720]|uniref:DUF3592 domain-containing protein n=1 Tax=Streptomyces sp. NRRL B-24720 TaxID=1476876 RepID=UPI0004C68D13|nr:DUF3592 domain-containing protein [Streptomyces sp. NRRL B-24720]
MGVGAVAVPAGIAAFGGMFAVLVGAYGLRQARRLSETGVRVQALVKWHPVAVREESAMLRPLLQFVTEDDRVMEVVCPVPSTRRQPFRDGDNVQISYDPADPRIVVVHGRERLGAERVFMAGGALVVLLAVTLFAVVIAGR